MIFLKMIHDFQHKYSKMYYTKCKYFVFSYLENSELYPFNSVPGPTPWTQRGSTKSSARSNRKGGTLNGRV
jgi:hypothetical protein